MVKKEFSHPNPSLFPVISLHEAGVVCPSCLILQHPILYCWEDTSQVWKAVRAWQIQFGCTHKALRQWGAAPLTSVLRTCRKQIKTPLISCTEEPSPKIPCWTDFGLLWTLKTPCLEVQETPGWKSSYDFCYVPLSHFWIFPQEKDCRWEKVRQCHKTQGKVFLDRIELYRESLLL